MNVDSPITAIKGIGERSRDAFSKINIFTVGDLLKHYPRTYLQYPKAEHMSEPDALTEARHAILARPTRTATVKNGRIPVTLLTISEDGKSLQLIWYRMPYIRSTLKTNAWYIFYGTVKLKNNRYTMEQPVIYTPEQYEPMELQLLPVYGLTTGITNNLVMKSVRAVLQEEVLFSDYLPRTLRESCGFCEYNYAIKQLHFPDSMDALIEARNRLVFDEFFLFIMGLQYQKGQKEKHPNIYHFTDTSYVWELCSQLSYELTGAQKRALTDILTDMTGATVMQRLLQGDVGSGKTIVAFLVMAWVAKSGFQSAIMAPTEVLARQHYETFVQLCRRMDIQAPVVLLTGSMTPRQKRDAYEKMQLYPNAMIIGTHALIQEKAIYSNLALVITDEQHRFGVRQRDTFSEKGACPHVIVMSATPIPRTLAIILYGDLDISVIDEVPARRLPIKNTVVDASWRPKAFRFIESQVRMGHQAYVICPLVEASENAEGENVTDYGKMLTKKLPSDIRVATLHGRMRPEQKNGIMEAFASGEIQVLVSTTVVEVGVNVPNATVMMIENAEKFGLAQLHQLRGRVGRGDAQSYCIMMNASGRPEGAKRLEILKKSNDGFHIASEDLKLRGPGDFFGIRQSGEMLFELADIYQDAAVMQKAADAVKEILARDPELSEEEHAPLHREMDRFLDERLHRMNL